MKHVRLKYVASYWSGSTPASGEEEFWGDEFDWVTPSDVSGASNEPLVRTQRRLSPEGLDAIGGRIAPAGSTVVTKRAPIGNVAAISVPAATNQGCFMVVAKDPKANSYLRYLLVANSERLQSLGSGSTFLELGGDDFGDLLVPILEAGMQHRIAEYLDGELKRLDGLMREKSEFVELLKEKRAAIIADAVTKGLDPDAPMGETRAPWLGDIPSHWSVVRAKAVFAEVDQRSETGDEEMLTVSHLTGVTRRADKNVNMFEAESNEGAKLCWPGDLVINTLWAWMGAMGVSPLHGIVSPAYHVYRPSEVLVPAYVNLVCRTSAFVKEVTRYSKGVWSSRLRLYPDGLFEVLFPIPPLAEQQQIVESVGRDTRQIDDLIAATVDSVLLLKERRSALISAAVMGRLNLETGIEHPPTERVGASCGS